MRVDDELRKEYVRGHLLEADAPADPFTLFGAWLANAAESGVREPNAMTLATVTAQGRPAARVVLLKGYDARGFSFYTNYLSHKGQELEANPWAALCFWWGALERQIRIEGAVEKLPEAESDAYFVSRPLGARLGAWASPQSEVISSREELEARLVDAEVRFAGGEPPRPPHWGGYLVRPDLFEFWQGGLNRLHDRLRYTRTAGGWLLDRLAP